MSSSKFFYNSIYWAYPLINWALIFPRNKLIEKINTLPKGKLLEIGVGNGAYLLNYEHKVTAIDNSEKMLKLAEGNVDESVDLKLMNGEELLFEKEQFDYVVLSFIVAVAEHPDKLLSEAHKVLKHGGQLFILNHFPPDNWFRYIDLAFSKISSLLKFNSNFRIENLNSLSRFKQTEKQKIGILGYYKYYVFEKNNEYSNT